jgi:hypothetical protein
MTSGSEFAVGVQFQRSAFPRCCIDAHRCRNGNSSRVPSADKKECPGVKPSEELLHEEVDGPQQNEHETTRRIWFCVQRRKGPSSLEATAFENNPCSARVPSRISWLSISSNRRSDPSGHKVPQCFDGRFGFTFAVSRSRQTRLISLRRLPQSESFSIFNVNFCRFASSYK